MPQPCSHHSLGRSLTAGRRGLRGTCSSAEWERPAIQHHAVDSSRPFGPAKSRSCRRCRARNPGGVRREAEAELGGVDPEWGGTEEGLGAGRGRGRGGQRLKAAGRAGDERRASERASEEAGAGAPRPLLRAPCSTPIPSVPELGVPGRVSL